MRTLFFTKNLFFSFFESCVCFILSFFAWLNVQMTALMRVDKQKALLCGGKVIPLFLFLSMSLTQVKATTCAAATVINPAVLPITSQALVCGTVNNITYAATAASVKTGGCSTGSAYYGGLESLYTLTPTVTGSYTISMTGQTWTMIMVTQGCPTTAGSTCRGAVSSSANNKTLTVTLTAGIQYFIMFDTWPTPNSPCPGTFSITGPPVGCTGMPTGGTTSSTTTSACASTNFTLSTTGSTAGTGLTYQWQSSPNGTTWTNITGATAATLVTNQTVNTYYRRNITCTASAQTASSTSLLITTVTCCNHTFNMTDSWGDGWNGANIGVRIGTTVVATVGGAFTGGTTATQVVPLQNGTAYNLLWTGGGFPTECGYTLLNSAGTTLNSFATGAAPATGSQFYSFTAVCPTPCSGTPTAGTTVSSSNPICASTNFTLSLSGTSAVTGLTYQWQSSPNGTAWTNIGAATAATLTTSQTTDTYYRCNVTCAGNTAASTSLLVTTATCINMTNGSTTACSGLFYDSGGPAGVYNNGENFTYTINPGTAGAKVIATFNSFVIETCCDLMTIYDGPNTASPSLGSFTTMAAGQVFQASLSNASGALTFVFTSDGSVTYAGWNATLSCFLPPPCTGTPAPGNTVSTSNSVCAGVNFTLSNSTPPVGTGLTYQWQSSPNGTAWTNIAGATAATLTTNQTVSTYYQCLVTCAGNTGTSTPLLVTTGSCINITNGSTTTCNGIFYDSGGATGDYLINETYTYTIFPNAGNFLQVSFSSFATENNYDGLSIYNGPNTASPLISSGLGAGFNTLTCPAGSFYGTTSPGTVTSTHSTGALTFVFTSEGSINAAGWIASISCIPMPVCAGTPNPGNTLSTANPVCDGANFTLSLQNATTGSGVTYQWQSSPNGTTWTNIAGATLPTLTTSQTIATYYRCVVTCAGNNGNSNPILINGTANAGTDVTVCSGAPSVTLNGSTSVVLSGTFTVVISGTGFLDEVSWTLTNSVGTVVGSGGVYATGSTNTIPVTISSPPLSFFLETQGTWNDNIANYSIICNGATIFSGTVNGGQTTTIPGIACSLTPTYTWSPSTNLSNPNIANPVATPTSTTTYTLTTDAGGCIGTDQVTVAISNVSLLVSSQTNVSCFGGNTGNVTVVASNGATPYQYNINGGAYQPGASFFNLIAGTYTIEVKDANNCTATTTVTITEPAVLGASTIVQNVSCNSGTNGAITIAGTGGTPGYQYQINGGGYGTSGTFTGLSASLYTLNVKDAFNCVYTLAINVTEPAVSLTGTIASQTPIICLNDGSVSVTASGGTGPYQYSIDGGALGTSPTFNGLAAGSHNVLIQDYNACQFTIPVTIAPSATFFANETHVDILCFGGANGSVTITATGGTPPYSGTGTFSQALGTQTYTVTDNNGCVASVSATISQPVAPLAATETHVDALCFGGSGSVTITATGGTSPYTGTGTFSQIAGTQTYTVTDNNGCSTTVSATVAQPAPSLFATETHVDALCFGANGSVTIAVTGGTSPYTGTGTFPQAAGTQSYTVTDLIGCSATVSATVAQPTASLTASETHVDALCFGANGSVTISAIGGTAPYTGTGTFSQAAGTQTYTVSDVNGCSTTVSVTIAQPTAGLSASIAGQTNVLCYSNSTGAADLDVTGGTLPYTYSWSNGATGQDLTGIAAGTYNVTVTDGGLCTTTASVTITEPSGGLTANIAGQTNVLCFGNSTGAADLAVTGGTLPYSYSWSNGATGQDLTGIAAGTYNVTVTDGGLCTTTASVTITEPSGGLTANIAGQTNVLCFGNSTGAADLNVTGGTLPYSYSWSNGAIGQDLTGIAAGTYNVTVTDLGLCTTTASVTITEPSGGLTANIAGQTNVLCFGNSTGAADLNVTGGTIPYTYSWSNGATGQDLTGISAGTYNVTVTDGGLCTTTASVTITEPSGGLTANIAGQTNVLCFGNSTGAADLNVTGGTLPYSYSWSNGATGQDLTGIAAGTYNVTVTDGGLCTTTASVTITEPTGGLTANIAGQTNVLCFGNSTGAADLAVTGGTLPYAYSWSNGATGQDLTGIAAGTYNVTVTDGGLCTTTASVTITEPSGGLTANIAGQTNVLCFGNSTGAADLAVTGGTLPYSYSWSNGATGQDLTGIAAGTYNVTVTDGGLCTTTASVTITEPTGGLTANIAGQTNVLCFGNSTGAADLNVTGGTLPYSYSWSNGATGQDLTGIAAGTYNVTVTDGGLCTTTASVTITEPSGGLTANIAGQTNVLCFGNSTGAADLAVTGGTLPYAYSWSNGATGQDLTGIAAGTYNVTVTDGGLCTTTASVTITEPTGGLTANIAGQTNVLCFGNSTGAADLAVIGGTLPYAYSWSNGATGQDLTGIAAGTYNVTVTDGGLCTTTASVTITEPTAGLSANIAGQTNVLCFGNSTGAADLNVTGGTLPYSYSWSNGATGQDLTGIAAGTYNVTVTDGGLCTTTASVTITEPTGGLTANIAGQTNVLCFGNSTGAADLNVTGGTLPYSYSWSNGATGQDLTGIAAGTYNVTVTDGGLCTTTASVTITQPTAGLSANIAGQTNVLCFGNSTGAADLAVTGGTLPYSYSWSNGATGQDLTGIAAGTYNVTVTDGGLCTTTASVIITEPSGGLSANIAGQTNVLCFGNSTGAADLAVTGGTLPYSYSWSNGATGQDLTGIAAGTYNVTVTDGGLCTTTASVTITEPTGGLTANIAGQTNVLCFGNSTGAADLAVTGGTLPYAYSWSNGATSEDLTGIAAGTYNVTITDLGLCTTTASVIITEPSGGLSANIAGQTNVLCFGNSTGAADLAVTGGTLPYSYSWSNGATGQDLTGIAAGTYNVTVTDGGLCTTTASVTITEPTGGLTANIAGQTNVLCFGNSTGAADLNVTGGTLPYSYSWSNGATGQDLTGIAAGTYNVTVTDGGLCTTTASVTITEPTGGLTANIAGQTNVLCYGNSTGAADLAVTGGTLPYSYSWSNGATGQDLTGIAAGTYNVTVTDGGLCTTTASVTITEPTGGLTANIAGQTNVLCYGNSTGAADLNVTGGTLPYSYSWSNGATGQDLTGIAAGTYNVTVTDGGLCTTTASVTITEPTTGLSANIAGQTNVLCFGNSTGTADLNVTGGTLPYSYSWSNGATGQDLTGIAAGTYNVTVTDGGLCTTTASVTITEPTGGLTANIAGQTNVLCYGNSTGAADLAVTGGSTPYTYSWSNGATSEDLTGIAAGTYNVTVTDGGLCTTTASVTITEPTGGLTANIAGQTNVLCFGNSTGAADLAVTGGTLPYSYSWSNGATGQDLTGIAAGTYNVTVTDGGLCTTTASVTITEPTGGLTANIAGQTNVLCFGNSTGAADLNVTGGTLPYSYSWSNGATGQDLTGIAAGTYNVTITDGGLCTTTASVTITEPTGGLTANIAGQTNVLCFGNSTGAADLAVTGGTLPYSYSWSNGATGQDLTGIAAGTYSVTVTDGGLCTTTASVIITEPSGGLSANIAGQTNVLCFGNSTGAADLNVTGGTLPYSYSWSNGATGQDLTGIAAGTYNVTITDLGLCTTTASVTITEPTGGLTANIAGQTNVLCFGNSTGAADLNVTGGTLPYSYSWSNGATGQDLTGIAAGTYNVTITDGGLCTTTASVTITEPIGGLTANIAGQTNVLCFGNSTGAADLAVTGGTLPYSYSWSNGATGQDLTGIAAGTYNVTVTDGGLCTTTASVTITEPSGGLTANIAGQTNVLCFGNSTGTADLAVTGGSTPYTYSWSNGATSEDLTGIAAGTYNVTVTDLGLCTTTASVTITEPSGGLTANIAGQTNVLCFGNSTGAADLAVTGGSTPYTYSWSNGATSEDLTGIAAGTYNVTITDLGLCTTTASVTITEPSGGLTASETHVDASCLGGNGSVTISATGGTVPYTGTGTFAQNASSVLYIVSDASGCSATVTATVAEPATAVVADAGPDATICMNSSLTLTGTASGGTGTHTFVWDNGATQGGSVTPLSNTTYTLTVSDANGCTDTSSMNVTVNSAPIVAAPSIGTTYVADYEATDAFGWTHYYDDNGTVGATCDDYLLLSLEKTTNAIGNVGDGTFQVTLGATLGAVHITNPPAPYVMALDWYVMNRYWWVTPTQQPSTDVPVRFYYTTADFDEINNTPASAVSTHTDLKFYKINGTGYNPDPSMGHAGVPAANAYNQSGYWQYNNGVASTQSWAYVSVGGNTHYAEYVVGSFSGGGGGGGGNSGAFPVEILSFSGYEYNADNVLEWTSKNEANNKGFRILKSIDNVAFESLDMVPSKAINGTSSEELSYSFVDTKPAQTTYYRLMQIDIDGKTTVHSQTVEINRTGESNSTILVYPNPAKDELNVAITNPLSQKYTIKVYDAQGKLVITKKEEAGYGQHVCKLDISKLAKGGYVVMVVEDENISSYRFMKE